MDHTPQSLRRIRYGLEDPVAVMLLDPKEWALIMSFFSVGILLRQLILGAVLAYVAFKVYRKFKGLNKRGYWFHLLWRTGIPSDKLMTKYFPKPTAVAFHE